MLTQFFEIIRAYPIESTFAAVGGLGGLLTIYKVFSLIFSRLPKPLRRFIKSIKSKDIPNAIKEAKVLQAEFKTVKEDITLIVAENAELKAMVKDMLCFNQAILESEGNLAIKQAYVLNKVAGVQKIEDQPIIVLEEYVEEEVKPVVEEKPVTKKEKKEAKKRTVDDIMGE